MIKFKYFINDLITNDRWRLNEIDNTEQKSTLKKSKKNLNKI